MASHTKVLTSNGRMIKRNQAIRRVEQCLSAWVDYPHSIRDLTLAEVITVRSDQARKHKGITLPWAELPNCAFRPSEYDVWGQKAEGKLASVANYFALSM